MKHVAYILILVLCSCGEKKTDALSQPTDLIDKAEYISILVELEILEAHFQRQYARVDLYHKSLDSSSYYIFEEHGVTKNQFKESMNFYASNPDSLYAIYEATLDSINFRISATNE